MPYAPILAALGYVLSEDGTRVLLIHRNARPDDLHFGKVNGLGGKLEPGEDVVTCITREIREEAGIDVQSLCLRGTINWPGFGKNGEDWFGFIFVIDRWTGTPFTSNPEGTLEWHPIDTMLSLNLWPGDRHFVPLVFDAKVPQFHGVMPYRDGQPLSWSWRVVAM